MSQLRFVWFLLLGFACGVSQNTFAQSAPAHLNYFGYVAIDCFYDDPLDGGTTTNYLSEVDSFSNLAHLCVYDFTDTVVTRVQNMNNRCVKPMIHLQSIFFEYVDTLGPSGANYDLYPDYLARWAAFKNANLSVLNPVATGCFYIADEPAWNGIADAEMSTISALLQTDFPQIPTLTVEAYASVDYMFVPAEVDWVGFDRYGSFDPQSDPDFMQNLDTVKARLSAPSQRLMLIIDDQWFPGYQTFLGWSQDTMADVVQNYYDLAAADTLVIGLIGYLWPGGLDAPDHYGVRNLTPAVIQKNVEIGQLIKANYNPCDPVSRGEAHHEIQPFSVYPNPACDNIRFAIPPGMHRWEISIYNAAGTLVMQIPDAGEANPAADVSRLSNGLYAVIVQSDPYRATAKFLIHR